MEELAFVILFQGVALIFLFTSENTTTKMKIVMLQILFLVFQITNLN